jgi:DNA-binding NarL/FixJ family response regulator
MSASPGIRSQLSDRTLRVLIADDIASIRKSVRSILEEDPRLEVCGEAENGAQAIKQAEQLKPDVVILNITMPVLNGYEAAREIRAKMPEAAIVILSSHADRCFIAQAKQAGANAYVTKSQAADKLLSAVEAAIIDDDFALME